MVVEERRASTRYELAFPVRIGDVAGTTRNLGLDGLLFVSGTQFSTGQRVSLDVTVILRESDTPMVFSAEGDVVRTEASSDGYLTAVRFETSRLRLTAGSPGGSRTEPRQHTRRHL